ncbi:MAG: hypothetical protein U0324_30500 [Polyangiales bacterium]
MGYGYKALTVENLVGFHTALTGGAWAEVDDAPYQRKRGRHGLPVLVVFKGMLAEAIEGLVAAQGADNDVRRADGPWDDAERRLVLTVQLQCLDPDASVRADAEQVRAQLCPDGGTAMTALAADAEVDFARNQLALARAPQLAPVVKRLGLGDLLDEIERRTDDLARAIGRGANGAALPRSKRIEQAHRGAVGAFNFAHAGLDRLAEASSTAEERAHLAALVAPFNALLARRVVAEKADAPANEDAAKPADAPAEKVRPTG